MCAHVCACARVCTWSAVRPVLWTVVPLEASQSEGIQPVVQAQQAQWGCLLFLAP